MSAEIHSLESDPISKETIAKIIHWKESGDSSKLSANTLNRFRSAVVVQNPNMGRVLSIDGRFVVDYNTAEALIIKSWKDPTIGYQSSEKLWRKLKETFLGISRRHVAAVVARFEANQLIGPKFSHTPVKPIVVSKPMKYLQADLIDRTGYATTNRNFAYLMTVVDVFSKYAFVVPLRNKEADTIVAAIEGIIAKIGPSIVKIFHTDNGTEFKNDTVADKLKALGIKPVYGQAYRFQSQGAVERFNQTVQMMIHRYLLQNQTNNYVDVLDTLVKNYNDTVHETTKQRPIDLIQPITAAIAKKIKVAKSNIREQADKILLKQAREFPSIEVGDFVRVIELKFQKTKVKGFAVKYRTDIYQVVSKRFHGNDYAYRITSNLSDVKAGPFETVSRFQIKKIPNPSLLIVPKKIQEKRQPKLLAEKIHIPRKELPDAPELRRSARVPSVKKAFAEGETKRGKSYRETTAK